jgi:PAS domain S-box-containing protein
MISQDEATAVKRPKSKVLELEELRSRLAEAEETLEAIRNGDVDALIVGGPSGERVYTLEGAETPYRQLVETMTEGALSLDGSGVVLYCNRRFAEMVGEPLEQVVGSSLTKFDADGGIAAVLEEVMRHGQARREATLPGRGSQVPVFVSASRSDGDSSGRVCVVVTDLTTQKTSERLMKAEEEARQHRAVAERRSIELARSNNDLETFAYASSHELKEPVRGIRNFANFLLEDHGEALNDEAKEKVRTILRLSARMHHLLDSLLQYARVGRTQIVREPAPLSEIAREAVDGLAAFLAEHGTRIEIAPGMPGCLCDRERMVQVLSNLISNAVKYNRGEARRVEIFAADSEPGTVTLAVRDNGIGIDPRQHERIFGVFHRLHGRDAYGGGAGIGLSLVKMLVEQQGGRVWVDSAPGKGSTFFVRLPGA